MSTVNSADLIFVPGTEKVLAQTTHQTFSFSLTGNYEAEICP